MNASRKTPKLTYDRARELLSYCAETGVLTWNVDRAYVVRAGDIAGTNGINGYRQIIVDGERHKAHRVAWLIANGKWAVGDIDHINGVRSDNRLTNLRDVSRSVNMQNQRVAHQCNQSGLLGVSPHKRNKKRPWAASINVGGKVMHLGYFATPEEAHAIYLANKRALHEGCVI